MTVHVSQVHSFANCCSATSKPLPSRCPFTLPECSSNHQRKNNKIVSWKNPQRSGGDQCASELTQTHSLMTVSVDGGPQQRASVVPGCYLHSQEEVKILQLRNNSLLKRIWRKWALPSLALTERNFTEFQSRMQLGHLERFLEQQFWSSTAGSRAHTAGGRVKRREISTFWFLWFLYWHSYCLRQCHINGFLKADLLTLTNAAANDVTATFWEAAFMTSSRTTLELCRDAACLTCHAL